MKIVNTLSYHLSEVNVSPASYIRAKHISLAKEVARKRKIYLDTRYWILFRDVILGRTDDPALIDLLVIIKEAVANGRAVCPLSQESFAEVFTQKDKTTLDATVKLIDELSESVCLTEFMQRINTEAYHFIAEKTKGRDSVYTLDELVWTKCGYVLGYVTPLVPGLPDNTAVAIEKAFFDQMWVITICDMLMCLGSRPDWRHETDIVREMNNGKALHKDDYNSFKQLFMIELGGILETLKPALSGIMAQLFFKDTGQTLSKADLENDDSGKMTANLIYNAFRLNKIKEELPTLRIHATLHAAMRWNPNRKYEFNDLADLRHAAMALPYCDLFLTEKPLCHLVNEKHLKLTERFRCRTICDPREALQFCREIGI